MTTRGEPLPPRPPRAPLPYSVAATPPLPFSARDILDQGLARLGLDLPADARAALEGHVRLLLAWTAHINLTAIREPDDVAREHVLDSLAAARLLRSGGVRRLLDLGSGGGFPGIPLAVALPESTMLLVESIAKKARFLQVAVDALGLADRVRVRNARAEALGAEMGSASSVPVEAVCVRAVAGLGVLAGLAAPLLVPGGWLVAWKRGDVDAEIAATAADLAASGFGPAEVHPVAVEGLEDHRLVVATLVRPLRPARPARPARAHRRAR